MAFERKTSACTHFTSEGKSGVILYESLVDQANVSEGSKTKYRISLTISDGTAVNTGLLATRAEIRAILRGMEMMLLLWKVASSIKPQEIHLFDIAAE